MNSTKVTVKPQPATVKTKHSDNLSLLTSPCSLQKSEVLMQQIANEETCNYAIHHKCKYFPSPHQFSIHNTKSVKCGKINTEILHKVGK